MAYRAPFSGPSRGRGSNTRGRSYPRGSSRLPPREESSITLGIGGELAVIELKEGPTEDPDAAIKNFVPVSSYSWADKESPTIIVPASPSIWTPKQLPFQCKPDTGFQWVNQNSHRVPLSPLTPLIETVRYVQPNFNFSAINIVTDRNNLRNLFAWATGPPDDFRIDVQRAGLGTVLFMRWEPFNRCLATRSYKSEFDKAMMQEDKAVSGENYRIVAYDFADLNLLVRFGVDACYPSDSSTGSDLDDLIAETVDLSSSPVQTPIARGGLQIVPSRTQKLVDQKDLIELATRSTKTRYRFDWFVKYLQLYLSGTPNFIIAVHNQGNFEKVETFRTDDTSNAEVRKAREEMQPGLNKLAAVLRVIHAKVLELTEDDATGSRQNRLLSIVCEKGKLRMYERAEGPKLPPSLVACFD